MPILNLCIPFSSNASSCHRDYQSFGCWLSIQVTQKINLCFNSKKSIVVGQRDTLSQIGDNIRRHLTQMTCLLEHYELIGVAESIFDIIHFQLALDMIETLTHKKIILLKLTQGVCIP